MCAIQMHLLMIGTEREGVEQRKPTISRYWWWYRELKWHPQNSGALPAVRPPGLPRANPSAELTFVQLSAELFLANMQKFSANSHNDNLD